ncbi:hypothetical protein PINS_up004078 [Pythium insidiosum]|nr:hypothetical protein PINS_up004078 [Pythium insidiosum]
MAALTNMAVEEKVLRRVQLKASTYGQDVQEGSQSTAAANECKVDPQLISDLYRDFVMPLTKEVQVMYLLQRLAHPSISVAGVEGSFCWLAALAHFTGDANPRWNDAIASKDHFVARDSVSKVFGDVAANRAAFGVVPIEDSQLGMVKETQAQLLRSSLKVAAEVVLTKSFTFAAKSKDKVKQGDVTTVYVPSDTDGGLLTHVEQCWPTAKLVTVANVTEAAQKASHGDTSSDAVEVAITTAGAARAHGLEIVEGSNALATATWKPTQSVANSSSNTLRFLVIAKRCPPSSGHDKSCLSMEIKHEVGSLLSALEVWKSHGVNLSCLESIYRQEGDGYDFFLEIDGHFEDSNVSAAVAKLCDSVCVVKHLGSFPIAKRLVQS